jgi:hypothetical protein
MAKPKVSSSTPAATTTPDAPRTSAGRRRAGCRRRACIRRACRTSSIGRRRAHLHELWRDAIGQLGTSDLTGANAPASAGNPFAYLETTTDTEIALFRSTSGVHDLYWSTGSPGLDNLSFVAGSPPAASDVVGTFNPANGLHHVAYRSSDGLLHIIFSAGGTDPAHYEGPLTTAVPGGAPLAVGDPSLYFDSSNQNIVVYRGADSNIHSIYWSLDAPGHDELSQVAGTPQAAGNPVAYHLPPLDLHQVTYRGVDGNIWELYWKGVEVVAGWNVTGGAGAPPASSDPAVYFSPGTNRKHVIYQGPFEHLIDVSWVPGQHPSWVDLTLKARAPRAVDRPAAFTVDKADTHYVVYVGTDHHVHEISWADTSWDRTSSQGDWRWCDKCQGMFYGGLVASSRCPAGGTHTPPAQSFSTEYHLPYNLPARSSAQGDWRWCNKCQGLFYGPAVATSHCPAGGTHAPPAATASFDYHLSYGISGLDATQDDWRWCNKCQGLFYGPGVATSHCPAGGTHAPPAATASFDYVLAYTWTAVTGGDIIHLK